jgi:hypothetical protein
MNSNTFMILFIVVAAIVVTVSKKGHYAEGTVANERYYENVQKKVTNEAVRVKKIADDTSAKVVQDVKELKVSDFIGK